jgi:hypothetical protein
MDEVLADANNDKVNSNTCGNAVFHKNNCKNLDSLTIVGIMKFFHIGNLY